MKRSGNTDDAKRRAGRAAVDEVDDDMIVGLGSGSTSAFAIAALGRAIDAGLDVQGVATSYQAADVARKHGVPLVTLDDVTRVDIAIDGADQVVDGDLIKGGGASHAREKVVDATANKLVIVIDHSKLADAFDHAVPIEVLYDARRPVSESVGSLGGEAMVREAQGKSGPVVTDNGNLVLDCTFGEIADPATLDRALSAIPGLIEHGLFVNMADTIYVGSDDGVDVLQF